MIWGILENPRNSDFVLSNPRVTSFRNLGLHPLLGVQFSDTNLGTGVTEVGRCPGNKGAGDRVAVWHQPSMGGGVGGEMEELGQLRREVFPREASRRISS